MLCLNFSHTFISTVQFKMTTFIDEIRINLLFKYKSAHAQRIFFFNYCKKNMNKNHIIIYFMTLFQNINVHFSQHKYDIVYVYLCIYADGYF